MSSSLRRVDRVGEIARTVDFGVGTETDEPTNHLHLYQYRPDLALKHSYKTRWLQRRLCNLHWDLGPIGLTLADGDRPLLPGETTAHRPHTSHRGARAACDARYDPWEGGREGKAWREGLKAWREGLKAWREGLKA